MGTDELSAVHAVSVVAEKTQKGTYTCVTVLITEL
jgi:hypothetical protein